MFGKKKKKELIEYEDEKFVIYQMTYPKKVNEFGEEFLRTEVASPMFGSKIPDRISYNDIKGKRDVDYNYDYARNEQDKHLTDEDIEKRFGSKYHEFQIMDNEKIAEYAGTSVPTPDPVEEEKTEVVIDKKAKNDSFATSIDEFMASDEDKEPEVDTKSDLAEFKINLENDDDNDIKYNSFTDSLDKPKETSIPSFLRSEAKPEEDTEDESNPFDIDSVMGANESDSDSDTDSDDNSFDFDSNDTNISFDDIPRMDAPDIEFTAQNNAPVDRNISIEEAMRRAENNEFPELMSGGVGSNRPKDERSIDEILGESPEVKRDNRADEIFKAEPKPEVATPKAQPKPQAAPQKLKDVTIKGNDYSKYRIPWDELFPKSKAGNDSHPAWLEHKKDLINETLREFNIGGEVINYIKGPAFTLYEIMLEAGVNVKKLNQIKDNFAMKLEVKSLRILTPIPGKNTVGIEAPNDKADSVAFGDIINNDFINDGKPLNVALGKLIDNTPVYQNIYNMPHALIAGATQSGKSVSINTLLVSLLIKNSPETLKLIIVDPKMVEFTLYEDIPHLATPIITDSALATEALHWCVDEMERRYEVLKRFRVKNVGDYNDKRKTDPTMPALPYIVVVVDEFNDLVMTSGAEVQDYIVRLAQKARAAGMHVILATQRPTTDVVNGTIKANIPCRIAFRVASTVDSMTILDQAGAEDLLGRGDMLIVNQGAPVRAQGAYLSDDEIGGLCEYLTSKYVPDYIFTIDDLKTRVSKSNGMNSFGSKDVQEEPEELLYQIARFCVESQSCSINSIQNSFGIGFNRASRIVSTLEERGIVSAKQGTKSRAILMDLDEVDSAFGMESSSEEL